MSFLSPLAFLLFALSVPLLLLYFLKVRRREQSVSSLLLWDPALRDREASAFFQRLQRDPLLLLQLLALLALTLALARPAVTVKGQGAQRTVLILDTSASMKATDVQPSRFVAAQREALAFLDRLPAGAEVMVIEAGIQPRVLVPFSRDREEITSALRVLEPRDLPNRLSEAIRTARALTAQDPRAEIRIFTDGAHTVSSADGRDDPRVHWTGVGRRGRNVGITNLAIRKTFYGALGYQAFASVVNFSEEPQSFTFTLGVDDQTIAEQSITLDPHVRRSVVVPFSHEGAGVVRARLGIADDLSADNTAYAVIPPPGQMRVLLVSPGNLFLEKALRADPQVNLDVRTPEAYQGGMDSFDVVVLDSVSPARIGTGRFILINTTPPDVPLEGLGRVEQPVIMDWDRTHPVMRYVDFAKVVIEEALRVRPLAAGKTLVEAVGGPLIYALEEPRRKAVFFGFDLFKTDFPLRVAFPIMLSNSLRWLHPAGFDLTSFQLRAGEPILLPVEHGVTAARVITPSGRSVEAQVTRGLASFTETRQVGVYTVVTARGETRVAVNLASADESDIAPRPLPARPETPPAEGPGVPLQRELWGVFALLAALLLALEGWLYWRRQTPRRWALPESPGDRWALGLRCVLVAFLLVSLLRPVVPRWVDRLNVMFLLDVSASVSLAAREHAYRFAAQALGGMQPGDQAGLIVFGQEAVVDQPLSPKPKLERVQAQVPGRGTDLAQAIQLSLAMLPAAHANRLVLLSDGRQNAGNALAAAQAAKDAAADIYYVPTPLTFTQEVVLESMLLPQEVKFGEPFDAKVVAWSQQDTQGRLSLFRNGEFLGSQVLRLSAGKNVFAYRQSLDQSGIHVYQAAIDVEGDTIEENNRAVATIVVRGRPQVLLAEKDRTHAQALSAALRAQHIDVTVIDPEGIPKDPAGLQKYDGLILSNVSSLKLTKKQMEHIRDYVRDAGGGLIMIGGEESFGLGGYYRTPIEEALPVTMEVKQRIEIPSLAVVLSIDRSGSMAMSTTDDKVTKLDLAKEAAHLVVDLLDERNEVGVMSWDTEFIWDVPLQRARNKSAIHHSISTIKAGGGTDGFPPMKESYRALFELPALLKHVIFLSDGQMTRGDFAGLIRRMVKDKITVSAIAIGKDADVQLMLDIAKWGRGRFYYTDDTNTIPRIFTLETQLASKASLIEQPFKPIVSGSSHEVLREIDWKNAPPLGGYVATTLKGTGEQLLMTQQEDPLLATWRYGLGRTAAFTSDAKSKWAVLWLRWGAFNKFWGQLTRWTLRTGTRSDTVATIERRDGVGEVTVEAVDPKGEFINFLEAQIGVVAPDKRRSVMDVEQVAPGRYRGRFPAPEEGVYLVGMAQRRGERMIGSQLAGLVVPYAQEFRDLGVDERFLRELAELTGGGAVAEPKDVFLQARRRSRLAVELWPWLVGCVAMLLLPEIALRRIGPGLFASLLARLRGPREGAPSAHGGGHEGT
ncbi:MAG: VWA domain-containing protein [Candidatus Rokubacteria bacterium]|nr:VWA domain-containing protein [Candidatus Rokubacteria bacterium]